VLQTGLRSSRFLAFMMDTQEWTRDFDPIFILVVKVLTIRNVTVFVHLSLGAYELIMCKLLVRS
jgi:hypothetical protein